MIARSIKMLGGCEILVGKGVTLFGKTVKPKFNINLILALQKHPVDVQ